MSNRKYSLRQIPKVPNYHNDGCGRDTYISFYNGGFGRYKLSNILLHEKTETPKHYYHPNLALCKPFKRYFCNGGGRDSYVYISLLEENEKNKGNVKLNNILRSYDNVKYPLKTSKNISPSKFEKKLINRIFYGKCPGLNDRFMSPKVKFLKKDESPKKEENIEQNNIAEASENKEDFYNTRNNRYDNKYNSCLTEGNIERKNKMNNSVYQIKKTPKKYKLEIGQDDNFMNSVKKIFLYNNANNKGKTNFYNNIKIIDNKNKRLNNEEMA